MPRAGDSRQRMDDGLATAWVARLLSSAPRESRLDASGVVHCQRMAARVPIYRNVLIDAGARQSSLRRVLWALLELWGILVYSVSSCPC